MSDLERENYLQGYVDGRLQGYVDGRDRNYPISPESPAYKKGYLKGRQERLNKLKPLLLRQLSLFNA